MLLSPGQSPRRLSSPSPSPSLSQSQSQNPNSNNSITPRKQSNTVLDEDSYVASIEKIIERDFFPDIPKLRDRLDWLEAVRSGDPLQIRDAQLKIIDRRARKLALRGGGDDNNNTDRATTGGGKTRETVTPGSIPYFSRNLTPFDFDTNNTNRTPVVAGLSSNSSVNNVGGGDEFDPSSMSLDEYFRRYTSEDNASFSKILEKANKKRKERFGYLIEGEKGDEEGDKLMIEDDDDGAKKRIRNVTDGYGTSDQPTSTLDSWKYTAKNLLMYHPADNGEVALTDEEKDVRIKGLTKEINRPNTRFHGKMLDSEPKDDDTVAFLYTPVVGGTPIPISNREADKLKKYDLEDLRKTPNPYYVELGKKADNGYSYVKTPSPVPGVDESPFITWGEIEGTPLRLEAEDTPIGIGGSGDGRHFNIQFPPTRDVKAHSLSREAARKLRERSKMFQKPPLPSPVRGGSASPSVRTLSSAAQKFVRNAISKSSSTVDDALRASYRGSSPGLSTPKSGRSMSRFGRDGSLGSRSPSIKEGSNPPW